MFAFSVSAAVIVSGAVFAYFLPQLRSMVNEANAQLSLRSAGSFDV